MTSPETPDNSQSPIKLVPLVREVLADLDTPLSIYLKLANQPYSYLFESVQGGEKWGRYSIIGLPCTTKIIVNGNNITISIGSETVAEYTVPDPLEWIENYQQRFVVAKNANLPQFSGGLVGYFGYETINYIEPGMQIAELDDPLGTPDILLLVSTEVVVFDNLSGKLFIIVNVEEDQLDEGKQRLNQLEEQLRQPVSAYQVASQPRNIEETDFISGFTEENFKAAVNIAKQYIVDGDIMQVVLSQRLSVPYRASPLDLYRSLRVLNPSPYMFYLDMDTFQIVGSSPEILVRLENGKVTVRPIAGTRRRGHSDKEDLELEAELLADPKELAEHLMLIDLGRNDVGRVSKTGSVELTDMMSVERYSHVMHIVSNVEGEVIDGMTPMDILRATFPAGTVSGAPKIRAMEIINELEPVKRGIYSGAVGYLGWHGNMDTAIAIRTAVIKDQMLHIQAGAGVVYDSQPKLEWKETMNKGRAIFRAVTMAEAGLNGSHR